MKQFNVINCDFNSKKFKSYNVMPYLVNAYNDVVEKHKKYPKNKYWNVPKTFAEFKEFVKRESQYQFWTRCEYEIILAPWPYLSSPSEGYDKSKENDVNAWKEHWKKFLETCDKWDVYDQITMNLDIITTILMEEVQNDK